MHLIRRVDAAALVPGDLVVVCAGETMPADGVAIEDDLAAPQRLHTEVGIGYRLMPEV